MVAATIACARCTQLFGDVLQFKTGDDQLESYAIGDVVLDIEPCEYEGFAEAFCPDCQRLFIAAENAASFAIVQAAVAKGRLRLWPARRGYDVAMKRPILERMSAMPIDVDDVRAAAMQPQTNTHNLNFLAWWHEHEVLDGDEHISPRDGRSVVSTWWFDRLDAVHAALVDAGWPLGRCRNLDVPVVIDIEHVLHVEVWRARPT